MGVLYAEVMLVALLGCAAAHTPAEKDPPRVVIETIAGKIELELDAKRAPVTVANFLRYVKCGYYTHGRFNRTVTMKNQPGKKVKIEVIKGGPNPASGKKEFRPIPLERTSKTGLKHTDGTISMARDKPESATAPLFVADIAGINTVTHTMILPY